MPVIAVRTAAVLLAAVGDGTSFPTAAHLASYAGAAWPGPPDRWGPRSAANKHPEAESRRLKCAMLRDGTFVESRLLEAAAA